MVDLRVKDGSLEVEVRGLHKLWAFRSRIDVPLGSITAVRHDPAAARGLWKGIRAPGTHVPGLIIAGTYYKDRQRHFFDVRRPERAIIVELTEHWFDRLVVEVDDPDAAMRLIEQARAVH